ncbi:trypsin 3A1-like [Lycorma delicatula]|uniref:trypsin 3A1-like n=1 Tax=Lycorma delicatula TaxID=130591 RepID=UPI003F512AAF
MDFYFHLILLVFLVSSGKVLSQENIKIKRLLDKHGSSLIVGGYPVTEGDIPYQVSLRELDRHFCGGTIISELFILTAGHCLENKSPSEMSVFGGAVLLKSKSGSVVPVRRISIHPSYDNVTLLNDIGILELDYKLEFSRTLKSIEISRSQFSEGSKCQVSGWGYISEISPDISVATSFWRECCLLALSDSTIHEQLST